MRIKSEHVARVLDVGQLQSGAPYIVMEYLEGSDPRAASGAAPVASPPEHTAEPQPASTVKPPSESVPEPRSHLLDWALMGGGGLPVFSS